MHGEGAEKDLKKDETGKKRDILIRLRKLEGQVKGLEWMIDEGSGCEAALVQFSVIKAAFEKVGVLVIGNAIGDCIREEVPDAPKLEKAVTIRERYLTYLK